MYRAGTPEPKRLTRPTQSYLEPRAEPRDPYPFEPAHGAAPPAETVDFWRMMEWMWAGRVLIVLCAVLGLVAALAASVLIPPRFAAYTDILINPAQIQLPSESLYNPLAQREAQLMEVGSRTRLLTSTNVLARVVDTLSLDRDPEFVGAAATPEEARFAAIRGLYERVAARRDGQSYVVTLSVWSGDPMKSVSISEAMIAAFRAEIAAADSDSSSRTADALTSRLDALRERANAAEADVETFRRENQLEGTGGELLSSQSLGQLNAQVNEARARLISAQARHAELRVLAGAPAAAAGTVDSPILTELRTRYAELQREISAQSAVFGPRHPNVSTLQPQLQSIEREMGQEIARMTEAARLEMEAAQSVLDQLTGQLAGMRTAASQDNEALVRLRELEREAEVQGAIYQAYLQRTAEIVESGQIDATNIRVISPPVPPESRSFPPRTLTLLALGGLGGLALGLALAGLTGLVRFHGPALRRRMAAAPARR